MFIFDYQMVKRDKGWEAFWGLLFWVGIIAAFGDISRTQVWNFVTSAAGWWLIGKWVAIYFVIGVAWAMFRWIWRNAKRARQVERYVADYLRTKKRTGTVIPDDLLEDWDNYVFGTQWLKSVVEYVADARKEYQRADANRNGYTQGPGSGGVNDREWRDVLSQDSWDDLGYGVRSKLDNAKKAFLTHYGVQDQSVIPIEMKALWLRRVTEPVPNVTGQPLIAEVAQEPEVLKNMNKLGQWMAWWFVDMLLFFLGDLIHEAWLFIIHGLRGVLQAVAHYQYRNVRKNFRTPPSPPTAETHGFLAQDPKPEPVEEV